MNDRLIGIRMFQANELSTELKNCTLQDETGIHKKDLPQVAHIILQAAINEDIIERIANTHEDGKNMVMIKITGR